MDGMVPNAATTVRDNGRRRATIGNSGADIVTRVDGTIDVVIVVIEDIEQRTTADDKRFLRPTTMARNGGATATTEKVRQTTWTK